MIYDTVNNEVESPQPDRPDSSSQHLHEDFCFWVSHMWKLSPPPLTTTTAPSPSKHCDVEPPTFFLQCKHNKHPHVPQASAVGRVHRHVCESPHCCCCCCCFGLLSGTVGYSQVVGEGAEPARDGGQPSPGAVGVPIFFAAA